MKLLEQLERLRLMHKLIKEEETGSPDEFANKLNVGKRQLYNLMDDLKLLGAPIRYNTISKTYYYETECKIKIDFDIDILEENAQKSISGGFFCQSAILLHQFRIHL